MAAPAVAHFQRGVVPHAWQIDPCVNRGAAPACAESTLSGSGAARRLHRWKGDLSIMFPTCVAAIPGEEDESVRNLMLLGLAISLGCGDEVEKPEPVAVAKREGPSEVEMVAAMEAHYTPTILAHDALIQGDLDAFRAQLAKTDSQRLPSNAPELWRPFERQLHDASKTAAAATDLNMGAVTMAKVALACGACHEGLDAGPVYPAPAPRDGDHPLQQAMLEHRWATERLWEGVTGPWDSAWERGSAALAETSVFADLESGAMPDESLLRREAELRSLGEEAKGTKAHADRAKLYGRVLATCGGCHQAMGVEIPPYK